VTLRVGVVLPIGQDDSMSGVPSYRDIREIARIADATGLDSVWVYDHLLYRFGGETTGIHECWTILAAIAEATTRVQLGTVVMCTSFRNPALLAKMAATLDHVSDGRLILGIGCGWHDPEYTAFGYPTDHRVGRFEEALQVIRDLIRSGRADLDGRWVRAADVVLVPPARPDLPILIAAKRPRMLELTARHADAWNLAWFGLPDERLAAARADLHEACTAVGRDPATLRVNMVTDVLKPGDVKEFRVLTVDEDNRRISLSLKQVAALTEDVRAAERAERDAQHAAVAASRPASAAAKPRKPMGNMKGGLGKSGALGMGLGDLKL
jgi:alkanesulfonate monooxygenase SsuD/methylene tetrahydromethanopterin reductase-like flavin-dependent oxidoreductase (luciferase family)